jgi:hypothetical protein
MMAAGEIEFDEIPFGDLDIDEAEELETGHTNGSSAHVNGKSATNGAARPTRARVKPTIRIGTMLHENIDESVQALHADRNLYQRDGQLVRVTRVTKEETEHSRVSLAVGSPQVCDLPLPSLRERLTNTTPPVHMGTSVRTHARHLGQRVGAASRWASRRRTSGSDGQCGRSLRRGFIFAFA